MGQASVGNQSACNRLQKLLNFSSDISIHKIITWQDVFVPMSAFVDNLYMLIQYVSPLKVAICSFHLR